MAVLFLAILMAFTDLVEAGIHEKRLIEADPEILYSSYSKSSYFSKSVVGIVDIVNSFLFVLFLLFKKSNLN